MGPDNHVKNVSHHGLEGTSPQKKCFNGASDFEIEQGIHYPGVGPKGEAEGIENEPGVLPHRAGGMDEVHQAEWHTEQAKE